MLIFAWQRASQPHPVPSPCLRRGVSPIPDPSPSGRAQLRSHDLNFSGKGNEACAPTGLPLRTTQQSCDHFAGKACPCGRKPFITGCYTSPEFSPRFLHGSTSNPWRKEGKRKGIRRGLEEGKKKRQRKAIALRTLQTLQQKNAHTYHHTRRKGMQINTVMIVTFVTPKKTGSNL